LIWVIVTPVIAVAISFTFVDTFLALIARPVGSLVRRFLAGFFSESLRPFIALDNYVSFVTSLVIPLGVIFKLPLVVLLLTSLGVITPNFLARSRKYAVLIICVTADLVSPPDVISQVMMGLPLLDLYEINILLSRLVWRRRQKGEGQRQKLAH